jgi:hypothetical protein
MEQNEKKDGQAEDSVQNGMETPCSSEADPKSAAAANEQGQGEADEKPAEAPVAAPVQPTYTPPVQPTYTAPQQPYGYQPPQQPYGYYPPQQPTEQPISVGGWIGRSLIPCIPFVGGIIYLIMLFVWMGDKTKEETFRNWAKAQLIVMGIAIGLVILLVIFSAALGMSVAESMY